MVANQKIPAPERSKNLVTHSVANNMKTLILQQQQALHVSINPAISHAINDNNNSVPLTVNGYGCQCIKLTFVSSATRLRTHGATYFNSDKLMNHNLCEYSVDK
jgi:hypothetical protein